MTSTVKQETAITTIQGSFTDDQIALIKRTICKGASDDELALFVATARRMGLDPFARQIWGVMRPTKDGPVLSIQVSIDGFRLIAERTGKYEGQVGPEWCGADKKWTDVWLDDKPPLAARVGVIKVGARQPTYAIANYSSYVQTYADSSNPTKIWAKMPAHMLGKCAESLALRKMFPAELSGVYTDDELGGQEYLDRPTEAADMSPVMLAAANTIIDEILACKTVAELDLLTPKLEKLNEAQKKAVRPIYRAHRKTLFQKEGRSDPSATTSSAA